MGKESKSGTQFYSKAGLRAVTIHLSTETHAKLVVIAKQEERSLQKTIRRILDQHVGQKRIQPTK